MLVSSTPYLAIRRWLPLVGEPNTQLQRIGRSLVLLLFPYTVVPLLFRLQPPDFSILISTVLIPNVVLLTSVLLQFYPP